MILSSRRDSFLYDMKKIVEKIQKIAELFPNKMTKEQRFINLVEEIGELANAIAISEGHKSKKRKRSDLEDSFADVLFNLIVLASLYNISLEKEIDVMLDTLKVRIDNREFED